MLSFGFRHRLHYKVIDPLHSSSYNSHSIDLGEKKEREREKERESGKHIFPMVLQFWAEAELEAR